MEKRFAYLDNLRSWVIFLVVVMHANVTYSGFGGWYYKEGNPDALDLGSKILFGLYGSFTQAWFMGILFFVAAYFAARSLAKHGPAAFVKERLFRLGVPLLFYAFVIHPFISYFLMNYGNVQARQNFAQAYLSYLASLRWISGTGPLWFVEALLLFSLPYALWRTVKKAANLTAPAPTTLTLVLLILAIGLAAFAIRLVQPIGTDVANLQLAYFASYIVLFLLGLHAGERKWLEAFPERRGLRWFTVTLVAGLPLWLVLMVAGGATKGILLINGGWYWQSFAYAGWEAFVAVGFSIGTLALFRKFLNTENTFTQLLARNSFAVFMFHAPVLIGISLLLREWAAPLLLKEMVVAPAAFVLTLAVSELILRRIPGLRAVLN